MLTMAKVGVNVDIGFHERFFPVERFGYDVKDGLNFDREKTSLPP